MPILSFAVLLLGTVVSSYLVQHKQDVRKFAKEVFDEPEAPQSPDSQIQDDNLHTDNSQTSNNPPPDNNQLPAPTNPPAAYDPCSDPYTFEHDPTCSGYIPPIPTKPYEYCSDHPYEPECYGSPYQPTIPPPQPTQIVYVEPPVNPLPHIPPPAYDPCSDPTTNQQDPGCPGYIPPSKPILIAQIQPTLVPSSANSGSETGGSAAGGEPSVSNINQTDIDKINQERVKRQVEKLKALDDAQTLSDEAAAKAAADVVLKKQDEEREKQKLKTIADRFKTEQEAYTPASNTPKSGTGGSSGFEDKPQTTYIDSSTGVKYIVGPSGKAFVSPDNYDLYLKSLPSSTLSNVIDQHQKEVLDTFITANKILSDNPIDNSPLTKEEIELAIKRLISAAVPIVGNMALNTGETTLRDLQYLTTTPRGNPNQFGIEQQSRLVALTDLVTLGGLEGAANIGNQYFGINEEANKVSYSSGINIPFYAPERLGAAANFGMASTGLAANLVGASQLYGGIARNSIVQGIESDSVFRAVSGRQNSLSATGDLFEPWNQGLGQQKYVNFNGNYGVKISEGGMACIYCDNNAVTPYGTQGLVTKIAKPGFEDIIADEAQKMAATNARRGPQSSTIRYIDSVVNNNKVIGFQMEKAAGDSIETILANQGGNLTPQQGMAIQWANYNTHANFGVHGDIIGGAQSPPLDAVNQPVIKNMMLTSGPNPKVTFLDQLPNPQIYNWTQVNGQWIATKSIGSYSIIDENTALMNALKARVK